ncbi:alpha/beta fold hydrolase [Paraburkholderia acidipaludis]|uniref:alpha/beta fold hydrolase n=1 Tax=Paraburkholderia acidipaludis TaxID=660537 RepID=UPI000482C151|nr:alpha/beta hydrolase [Paraburkholderia acidipaludis]
MESTVSTSSPENHRFAFLPPSDHRGPVKIEYRWLNAHLLDKPIAIFLHEGLGSVAMWKTWPQTLCDRLGMRGLVYSRPGYGRSTPRQPDARLPVDFMTDQARDVLPALLSALGVGAAERRRMWLVGHSDGGTIALLYASAFNNELAGAVVIAPHVFVEAISVENIAEAKVAYETTTMRERLGRYHDDVDSAFYGWNDVWLSEAFRDWNIVRELAGIRCPLLAVQARDDQYGTLAQVQTIVDHVPSSQLVALESGGHSPHVTVPAVLNEEIHQFILSAGKHAL